MSVDLTFHIRRLGALASECGVEPEGSRGNESSVDTSKMTAYEVGQYRVACQLKRLRENITELDDMGDKHTQTQKTILQQQIRKDITSVKKETQEVMKAAKAEGRKEEYSELKNHVEKTESLYKNRFRTKEMGEAMSGMGGGGSSKLDSDMNGLDQPMVSLRDDEEFIQFFQQTQKNDEVIDKYVDSISAGVQRLHQNAVAIKEELVVQNAILAETEEKVDSIDKNLKGLNRKLKKTINEVDKDKMCIYAFCFILLLGLAGGVYWAITSNEKSSK